VVLARVGMRSVQVKLISATALSQKLPVRISEEEEIMDEEVLQHLEVIKSIHKMVLEESVNNEEEIRKLKGDIKVIKAQLTRLGHPRSGPRS
jgi:hypothetical protein